MEIPIPFWQNPKLFFGGCFKRVFFLIPKKPFTDSGPNLTGRNPAKPTIDVPKFPQNRGNGVRFLDFYKLLKTHKLSKFPLFFKFQLHWLGQKTQVTRGARRRGNTVLNIFWVVILSGEDDLKIGGPFKWRAIMPGRGSFWGTSWPCQPHPPKKPGAPNRR